MLVVERKETGDTLIEVIIACAILAMICVSVFSIMQRGVASAYDGLERSQVRLMLDRQAEYLYYFRDQYVKSLIAGDTSPAPTTPAGVWNTITSYSAASSVALNSCPNEGAFYLTAPDTAPSTTVATTTSRPEPGKGLWIVRQDANGFNSINHRFRDFYIVACWTSVTGNEQSMSSVVRMYEPEN